MPTTTEGRRPLKSRDLPIFKNLAAALARAGVAPNAISFFSIVFGIGAGVCFAFTAQVAGGIQIVLWLGAAACIQARLIANLLDGMVAVEGGRGGPTGDLWNEAPDRVADAAIFIGAGFAAGSEPALGYLAALGAVFVAYVRALGASVGAGQLFLGPMAKQHRMALMTGLAVVSAVLPASALSLRPTALVLAVIVLGCLVTAFRRLRRIAAFLRNKAA